MLLVKTKLGLSQINGIGLFADQFIPKGTVTWRYEPGFDQDISDEVLQSLSEPARDQVIKYSYVDPRSGYRVLCSDDARFYNHSDDPNTGTNPDNPVSEDLALRDIQIGDEITCNYLKDLGVGGCELGL